MSVFLPQEFLARLRDGRDVTAAEIKTFISGFGDGQTSAAQIGAFAMAVRKSGLSEPATIALTEALRDSGDVMRWDVPGPVLDKHSTGGVGDNVSLILGPVIAACGGYVPMISGQGLGHTGGTLDKLSAIPGYRVDADNTLFRKTVQEIGCAIIGQTARLAPADKTLYAIRSATACVDSVPLITASILSKKLAEGLDALVLDIKCGNGAMMQDVDAARTLAKSLCEVANGAGVRTTGLITDMNQPLASAAGNALEVINVIEYFNTTARDARLDEVIRALCVEMLLSGGLAESRRSAGAKVEKVLADGQAAELFARMVAALGGPKDILENPQNHFPPAPVVRDILAEEDGVISRIETKEIGLAVIVLGGGRKTPSDVIDLRVGFDRLAGLGARVRKGDVLARVHAADTQTAAAASQMLRDAYMIGEAANIGPLIIERTGAG